MADATDNEAVFVGYWRKMLARYSGITPEEYDRISKARREAKTGKSSTYG